MKKLVYITGIDGCGKTTQSRGLAEYLNENNFIAQYQWLRWSPSIGRLICFFKRFRFPRDYGVNEFSVKDDKKIQAVENESFEAWSRLKSSLFNFRLFRFLWLKYATYDYYYSYVKESENWNSDILVLDRYYFDFVIDQSLNYNEDAVVFERRITSGVLSKLKIPDIFIFIEISAHTGWERKRDGTSLEHLEKLSRAYSILRNDNSVHIIDGNKPAKIINKEIVNIVLKELDTANVT